MTLSTQAALELDALITKRIFEVVKTEDDLKALAKAWTDAARQASIEARRHGALMNEHRRRAEEAHARGDKVDEHMHSSAGLSHLMALEHYRRAIKATGPLAGALIGAGTGAALGLGTAGGHPAGALIGAGIGGALGTLRGFGARAASRRFHLEHAQAHAAEGDALSTTLGVNRNMTL